MYCLWAHSLHTVTHTNMCVGVHTHAHNTVSCIIHPSSPWSPRWASLKACWHPPHVSLDKSCRVYFTILVEPWIGLIHRIFMALFSFTILIDYRSAPRGGLLLLFLFFSKLITAFHNNRLYHPSRYVGWVFVYSTVGLLSMYDVKVIEDGRQWSGW